MKKFIFKYIYLLMIASVLTSCNTKISDIAKDEPAVSAKVMLNAKELFTSSPQSKITVFTWGLPADKIAREAQAKLFSKINKDIKVDLVVSTDYNRKLNAMIASNNVPDVFETSSQEYGFRINNSQAIDLSSYILNDNFDTSIYYPKMYKDLTTVDGKHESLPIGMSTYVMAINKDMFRKAGLAIPNQNGWTWQEALSDAQKMTVGEGKNKIYGMSSHNCYYQIAGYLYGGSFISDDFVTSTANNPNTLKGIQFITDLIYKHKVMPDEKNSQLIAPQPRFYSGKSAMIPIINWEIPDFKQNIGNKFDWDIVPMPAIDETDKAVTMHITVGYSISATSTKQDESWRFIKWATSDPVALHMASMSAITPTLTSKNDFLTKNTLNGKKLNTEVFLKAIDDVNISPFGGGLTDIDTNIQNMWNTIHQNSDDQQDVTNAVSRLSKEIQTTLNNVVSD